MAYRQELEHAGQPALADPISDLSGEFTEGTGVNIDRTTSLEEARSVADGHPMHKTGTRAFTIRRWLINEGSLQLDLKLSSQSAKFR